MIKKVEFVGEGIHDSSLKNILPDLLVFDEGEFRR